MMTLFRLTSWGRKINDDIYSLSIYLVNNHNFRPILIFNHFNILSNFSPSSFEVNDHKFIYKSQSFIRPSLNLIFTTINIMSGPFNQVMEWFYLCKPGHYKFSFLFSSNFTDSKQ